MVKGKVPEGSKVLVDGKDVTNLLVQEYDAEAGWVRVARQTEADEPRMRQGRAVESYRIEGKVEIVAAKPQTQPKQPVLPVEEKK